MDFTYSPRDAITTTKLAVGSTVVALSSLKNNHDMVLCTIETAPIRIGFGGLTPAATTGHRLDVGDTLTVEGYNQLYSLRMIRDGATSAVVNYTLQFPQK